MKLKLSSEVVAIEVPDSPGPRSHIVFSLQTGETIQLDSMLWQDLITGNFSSLTAAEQLDLAAARIVLPEDAVETCSDSDASIEGFVDRQYEFLENLVDGYVQIRKELEGLGEDAFGPVPESKQPGWGAFPLHYLGTRNDRNCAATPYTAEVVESIPYMTTACFAALQPHRPYGLHRDKYPEHFLNFLNVRWNANIRSLRRLQFPIIADKGSYLIVGREARMLTEGSPIVFDNRNLHAAYNGGERNRLVLVIDFLDSVHLHRAN
ncbi:MAG: aspartyl/asparaginyl beta-hydroxylase domain-containing protein [Pirellulales bacterium]